MNFKHIIITFALSIPITASAWESAESNGWHHTEDSAIDNAKVKAQNKVTDGCSVIRGTWAYLYLNGSRCDTKTAYGTTQYKCTVSATADCRR